MKEREWTRFLDDQAKRHDKHLFTLTELSHAAQATRGYTKLQAVRLVSRGVLTRHAHGLYGLPGPVPAESLVQAIDPTAYVTGSYALHRHALITQSPAEIDCFTLMPRARPRHQTTAGVLVFTSVRAPLYAAPPDGFLAGAEQALHDFLWLCKRRGIVPEQAVTWRNLNRLRQRTLGEIGRRYPDEIRNLALRLCHRPQRPTRAGIRTRSDGFARRQETPS